MLRIVALIFCASSAVAGNLFSKDEIFSPVEKFRVFSIASDKVEDISRYSYQAAIVYNISNFVLPGAIVHKKFIITSAIYPVFWSERPAQVKVGENHFDSLKYSYDIEEVIVHPKFSFGSKYNVALLKLSKPVKFSKNVRRILISSSSPQDGSKAFSTTWSRKDINGSSVYDLQEYETYVYNKDNCKSEYISSAVSETSVCTENLNIPLETKDSGAPLVQNGKLVGLYQGLPLMPYYRNGELYDLPHVYTDLSTVKDWIDEIINY